MMTAPVRPEIFALCTYSEAEMPTLTMRQAVEWFKQVTSAPWLVGASPLEVGYIDKYWAAVCRGIAKREGVPEGWVAYSLSQLAQAEGRVLETAVQEAAVALAVAP